MLKKLSKAEFVKLTSKKQEQNRRKKALNEKIKANEEGKSEYFSHGNFGTW